MRIDDIIAGLNIFKTYDTDQRCITAEHEQIISYTPDDAMTQEEIGRLKELGWYRDPEDGYWTAKV